MSEESDVELVAQLVGSTSAHLKGIDREIVDSSNNLKISDETWDPQQIVKDHVLHTEGAVPEGTVPPPPPSVHPSMEYVPPRQPVQPMQQGYTQLAPIQQPVVQVVTREFEDRLVQVETKLDIILDYIKDCKKLDEKISSFVDRGLKNRVKQITLKLDDTKD